MNTAFCNRLRHALLLLLALLLCTTPLLTACETSPSSDPFCLIRGDFDAEITWQMSNDSSSLRPAARYTATVRFRDGLLSMTFTSPESMAGMSLTETEHGKVSVRRGEKQLSGTAFGQYLSAARLITETGIISQAVTTADGTSLSYLVKLSDGRTRSRTMSLDGNLRPLFVTDPGYTTVRVVWFEPFVR